MDKLSSKVANYDRQVLRRCKHRVQELEAGIARFLEAEESGEMGNRDKAIEHLEHLMEDR